MRLRREAALAAILLLACAAADYTIEAHGYRFLLQLPAGFSVEGGADGVPILITSP